MSEAPLYHAAKFIRGTYPFVSRINRLSHQSSSMACAERNAKYDCWAETTGKCPCVDILLSKKVARWLHAGFKFLLLLALPINAHVDSGTSSRKMATSVN